MIAGPMELDLVKLRLSRSAGWTTYRSRFCASPKKCLWRLEIATPAINHVAVCYSDAGPIRSRPVGSFPRPALALVSATHGRPWPTELARPSGEPGIAGSPG